MVPRTSVSRISVCLWYKFVRVIRQGSLPVRGIGAYVIHRSV